MAQKCGSRSESARDFLRIDIVVVQAIGRGGEMVSDHGMRRVPEVRLQRTYIVELDDRRELS